MKEDEVQLTEIVRALARRKVWLFGLPLAAIVCALVVIVLMPREFEALALIRIGHIGQAQADRPIEPVAVTIERLRLRPFQDKVSGPLAPADGAAERLYRRSIAATAVAGADDLVRINVRGYTPEEARQFAQATADALIALHRGMQEPVIALMRSELDQILQALQEVSNVRSELGHGALANDPETAGATALQINVAQSAANTEINILRRSKIDISARLSTVHTFPTALLDAVSVPDEPVSPNRILILVLAIVVGSGLGILAALIRDYVSRVL